MSTPLTKYVFTKSIDRGGPGITPEWPGADPALHRFYLVEEVEKVLEDARWAAFVIATLYDQETDVGKRAQRLLAELEEQP